MKNKIKVVLIFDITRPFMNYSEVFRLYLVYQFSKLEALYPDRFQYGLVYLGAGSPEAPATFRGGEYFCTSIKELSNAIVAKPLPAATEQTQPQTEVDILSALTTALELFRVRGHEPTQSQNILIMATPYLPDSPAATMAQLFEETGKIRLLELARLQSTTEPTKLALFLGWVPQENLAGKKWVYYQPAFSQIDPTHLESVKDLQQFFPLTGMYDKFSRDPLRVFQHVRVVTEQLIREEELDETPES